MAKTTEYRVCYKPFTGMAWVKTEPIAQSYADMLVQRLHDTGWIARVQRSTTETDIY